MRSSHNGHALLVIAVTALTVGCGLMVGCGSSTAEPAVDAAPPSPDVGAIDAADDLAVEVDQGGPDAQPADPTLVAVSSGLLRGKEAGQTVAFLGVPFAEPPLGPLRWRPAQPAKPWSGERAATAFAPKCLQKKGGKVEGREDCLYLNIWTPKGYDPSAPAPVLLFVHGGGNMSGSAKEQPPGGVLLYDGEDLAARGKVVVVTVQYRLNLFGHLVLPELEAESAQKVSGNYALRDQIAALAWVQKNIGAFGGDPKRLLLFGESGGASDVCGLLASPLAKGLFSAALIQSGGCGGKAYAEVQSWSEAIATKVGCESATDPLACLRGKTGEQLLAAMDDTTATGGKVLTPAGPTIDGYVLPKSPLAMLKEGSHNPVPVVIGSNEHETASNLFQIPWVLSVADYEQRVRLMFGLVRGNKVLAQYPAASYPTPRDALVAVTTDLQFTCPTRSYLQAAAAHPAPAYRYVYSHVLGGASAVLGAAHGIELYFVFQKLERLKDYTPTAQDLALQQAILGYWTRFAATGDPNGAGAVPWPRYQASSDPYLELRAPVTSGQAYRKAACDFWETL